MDTAKHVFQLHGADAAEQLVLRKKMRRQEMVSFFRKLPPIIGHEVKLVSPQHVKPYVKRGKNDAADAEALCEAMTRSVRFTSRMPSAGRRSMGTAIRKQ